ncbi:MAG: cupin domain-containing protein [Ferruginibacter sp.]
MEAGKIVSIKNAEHYKWGQNNDGWHLLKTADLSIIQELMAPGNAEQLHFHEKAQQLFYILSGEAQFELNGVSFFIGAGETIHVPPGIVHKISNNSFADLQFIVTSSPASHGDRINVS